MIVLFMFLGQDQPQVHGLFQPPNAEAVLHKPSGKSSIFVHIAKGIPHYNAGRPGGFRATH